MEQPLPTRLISVGKADTQDIRLVESGGQKGMYITLSHCWGGGQPYKTTSENYEANKSSIDFRLLPRTFQDAITVTRELGFEYIWIDSLCIIQDSHEDWDLESARMTDVYERSALNIAGPGAPSPDAGFLHQRENDHIAFCVLPSRNSGGLASDLGLSTSQIDYKGLERDLKEQDSPLARRAWVLQERLLCPRMLFFGSKQLYFECMTTDLYECFWGPISTPGGFLFCGPMEKHELSESKTVNCHWTTRAAGHLGSDKSSRHKQWCRIIEQYSACALSRISDKLPALAGLAQKFSGLLNDRYLAGIWRDNFKSDLLWRPHRWKLEMSTDQNIGPSWSWVSFEGSVRSIYWDNSKDTSLKLLDYEISLAGHNEYGRVTAGHLTLLGRVRPFDLFWDSSERERYYDRRSNQIYLYEKPDLTKGTGPVMFCDICPTRVLDDDGTASLTCLLLAKKFHLIEEQWDGLVIVPVPGQDQTFRRVGTIGGPLPKKRIISELNSSKEKELPKRTHQDMCEDDDGSEDGDLLKETHQDPWDDVIEQTIRLI